jgi:hypothetical protein
LTRLFLDRLRRSVAHGRKTTSLPRFTRSKKFGSIILETLFYESRATDAEKRRALRSHPALSHKWPGEPRTSSIVCGRL